MNSEGKAQFERTGISETIEEWKEKRIGDEIELCYGKGLPATKRKMGKIPVFGSNGVVGYHNEFLVKGPGVIIGRKGSVGEVKFSTESFWPIDTTYFLKLKNKGDIRFWYYFLLTLKLNKMNTHSAVPGLNRDTVFEVKRKIPEFTEQQAIAKILSNLDLKIEVNQQMNKTLEAIGQAIFKRWFVDFEFPNEEGKPYKSSGGKMVYSGEIGKEIPQSFKMGPIYDLCEVVYGYPFSSTFFNREQKGKPLIRIRDLKTLNPKFSTTEQDSRTTLVKPGDIIAGMDAEFTPYIWLGEISYLNQRLCMFEPKEKHIHEFFLYQTVKPLLKRDETAKVGTTVIHLCKSDIDLWRVIVPNENVLAKFRCLITPIFERLILGSLENRNLSQIRDSLLPKLMSGKIRAPVPKEDVAAQ